VSQAEAVPLPEFAEPNGDPQQQGENLKELVADRGITLEYNVPPRA
jgi:hypothetical protein